VRLQSRLVYAVVISAELHSNPVLGSDDGTRQRADREAERCSGDWSKSRLVLSILNAGCGARHSEEKAAENADASADDSRWSAAAARAEVKPFKFGKMDSARRNR
jgi:hypothetical protein